MAKSKPDPESTFTGRWRIVSMSAWDEDFIDEEVVEDLSARLSDRYGKGFSVTNLWYFKQFYQVFQNRFQFPHPAGGESSGLAILHPVGAESSATSILSPLGIELARPKKSRPVSAELPPGFSHLDIDGQTHWIDPTGRPRPIIKGDHRTLNQLV